MNMKSESQNIEYKSSWRDEYLKWICGFANAQGGTIILGVKDDKTVIGIENAKKLLEDIPNKVQSVLGIMIDVNLEERTEGDVLEIVTEAYPYPVNYKGRYFYRSGSTMKELIGSALNKFLLEKQGKHWDSVPVPGTAINDIDSNALENFRSMARKNQRIKPEDLKDTNEHLLSKLQLVETDKLKRAGVLLFYSDPEQYISGAYIKIGYFESDDDLIYQDEIHGNIFMQIERLLDLMFTKYIKQNISYDGATRIETFEYPFNAIREAILNAIAHKDYSMSTPIQISVYPDKIIFWNPGQLPDQWTIENLLIKHPSIAYNPDIANTLFRCGYIESWGRGTLKMINECKEIGVPSPKYEFNMSGFFVTFRKDIYHKEYLETLGLNDRQIKAVLFVKEKTTISNSQYQDLNKTSRITATRDLSELVEKFNIFERSGKIGAGTFYKLIAS
jgi:ATP-dependent DNA helicase RecG